MAATAPGYEYVALGDTCVSMIAGTITKVVHRRESVCVESD